MMSPDDPKLPVSPQDSLYRDGTEALRQEAQRLGKRHRAAIEALRRPAEPVFVARCGRVAAGGVMVGGVVALIATGLVIAFACNGMGSRGLEMGLLTAILLGTWPVAGLACLLGRAWARRSFERRMLAPLDATADVHADLDRARRFDPGQHAMRMLNAMEADSMAPLLCGITMLLPLTLHFFAGLVLGAEIEDYDAWIALSGVAVGHCHLILGVSAWRYVRRLATMPAMALVHRSPHPGWKTYGIVLASSLFPGVLLMFVPVILVAVTGLFIPLVYGWSARRIGDERDALAMTTFCALSVATEQV
jgi:hypothetical protein